MWRGELFTKLLLEHCSPVSSAQCSELKLVKIAESKGNDVHLILFSSKGKMLLALRLITFAD